MTTTAGAATSFQVPTNDASTAEYRLDLYEADGEVANHRTRRYPMATLDAARFLTQATFGPTRAELSGHAIASDSSIATYSQWVDEQIALPPTLVRAHYRQRANPRVPEGFSNHPAGMIRPACAVGSRWHTYSFTLDDKGKTVHAEAANDESDPSAVRMRIDGEGTRTELWARPAYASTTYGACTGLWEPITSLEECTLAASALGHEWLNTNGYFWDANLTTNPAVADGKIGSSSYPPGCYLTGLPRPYPRYLRMNLNMSNTDNCQVDRTCVCKRRELSGAAAGAVSGVGAPPATPASPSPPPPLSPPPLSPMFANLTHPSQCAALGRCCTVIFKGAHGDQCEPVPIWDMTDWVHPGNDVMTVLPSSLCGTVRYNWLSKNGGHDCYDQPTPTSNCDPEAEHPMLSGYGGIAANSATRIGTYTSTHANCDALSAGETASSVSFKICDVDECEGCYVKLVAVGQNCNKQNKLLYLPNPPLVFNATPPTTPDAIREANTQAFGASQLTWTPLQASAPLQGDAYFFASAPTTTCHLTAQRPAYLFHSDTATASGSGVGGGKWYRHDRRLALIDNTIAAPAAGAPASIFATGADDAYDGARGTCPAVVPTFVNRGSCVQKPSCSATTFPSAHFILNHTTLTRMYEVSGSPLYRVRSLRLETQYFDDSPCDNVVTRWEKVTNYPCGSSETPLDNSTKTSIVNALLAACSVATPETGSCAYYVDIDVQNDGGGGTCHNSLGGVQSQGASVTFSGSCWRHVHPEEGNVYAFAYWVGHHEGNEQFPTHENPILRRAKEGLSEIHLPSSHSMKDRWRNQRPPQQEYYLPYVGRFGDRVDFSKLHMYAQDIEVATLMLGLGATDGSAPFVACGSPGEVANEPTYGHRYMMHMTDELRGRDNLFPQFQNGAKHIAWTNVVLTAADQLRHRMAFALSQVLVVGEEGLANEDEPELYVAFYDIFVRHAFGSYRDVMREVSYSPQMSIYLSYKGNKKYGVGLTNPDENYAREIMQLFSIGLYELHLNGTIEANPSTGELLETYDNSDIMTFARAWTGFNRPAVRTNLESPAGWGSSTNQIDPSSMTEGHRDQLPKTNLYDGYLGDGFPLCADLPPKAFLRKGATYRYLGASPRMQGMKDPTTWQHLDGVNKEQPEAATPRLLLNASSTSASPLFQALCAPTTPQGPCTYPLEVVLPSSIACTGRECNADTLRLVKVVDDGTGSPANPTPIFYEYIRPACVELSFFENATTIRDHSKARCADPTTISGGVACCTEPGRRTGEGECEYLLEHTLFATAEARCAAVGKQMCDMSKNVNGCGYTQGFVWNTRPCTLKVQVDPEDGWVNFVHAPHMDGGYLPDPYELRADNKNRLTVRWEGDAYPTPANGMCTANAYSPPPATPPPPLAPPGSPGVVNYAYLTSGNCATPVTTMADCQNAAAALGLADTTVDDDGQSNGVAYDPPWCYFESGLLKFNAGGPNTGPCTSDDLCLCETGATSSTSASQPSLYATVISGTCPIETQIGTITECEAAAAALGFVDTTAEDDGHDWGSGYDPVGCYVEGGALKFNVAQMSYGECSPQDQCLCYAQPPPPPPPCEVRIVDNGALSCFCDVEVSTVAVFTDLATLPTTAEEVISSLSVSHPPLDMYDAGTFTLCTLPSCNAVAPTVKVHFHAGSGGGLDEHSLFEVAVNGTATLLVNKRSTVHVGDMYSFRNPPRFLGLAEATDRDALYETEALLDHLFYHKNVAPFIAMRLIQRFVTSNPSPRYVETVATAFKEGQYGGNTYGGAYGDLGATIAATLLDREARSRTLDLDPTHGQVREPLLKLLHFMRSLDYTPRDGFEVELYNLEDKIGQMAFYSPTVFNFYTPDYQPIGPISASALTSPESEITTAPNVLNFLNGVRSLVRLGLTLCEKGFGSITSTATAGSRRCSQLANPSLNEFPGGGPYNGALDGSSSDGALAFAPNTTTSGTTAASGAEVVAELDLLLTAGRMTPSTSAALEAEYDAWATTGEYFVATSFNCTLWQADIIPTLAECEAAIAQLGLSYDQYKGVDGDYKPINPKGCYLQGSGNVKLWHNTGGNNEGYCRGTTKCVCKRVGQQPALQRALELTAGTPEFHVTNDPQATAEARQPPESAPSSGRPYKAIVVLFLAGGSDSWNLVVPRAAAEGYCAPGNTSTNYESYATIRGGVALPYESLLPINVPNGTQPSTVCTSYGVHPSLTKVHQLYGQGDAAFFANVGTLVEPMTKYEYMKKLKTRPPSLFAHNIQVRVTQSVHAQDVAARGVLGRIVDELRSAGPSTGGATPSFAAGAYSVSGVQKIMEGERPATVLDRTSGVVRLLGGDAHLSALRNLSGNVSRSAFAESFSRTVDEAITTSESLGAILDSVTLPVTFPSTKLGTQFEQAAKVIAARGMTGEERSVFFVSLGGWDTHNSLQEKVKDNMDQVNGAIDKFVEAMQLEGVWNDVAVLTASDFARTMGSNGAGTDHAWGGNYFLLGGNVNGSQIFGEFPTSLDEATSDVNIGRNHRILPTTPWESVWNGLAEWFGVPASRLASVLPNAANFPSERLFYAGDLFKSGSS